jgi:hypothetical protein
MVSSVISHHPPLYLTSLLQILPRTTSLSMMLMSTPIKPRHQPTRLRTPLPQRRVPPRNPLKAQRILRHRVRNTLRVKQVRIGRKVVDIVALLVVACIERRAGFTAEHLRFLLCLEDFSAGEETAGWDAVFEESGVVGA